MIKRPYFLLFALVPSCMTAQAQTTATTGQRPPSTAAHAPHPTKAFTRWSVGFVAGPAFPVGGYASLDHATPSGGPIHAGGVAEVSGVYHVNRSWGIVVLAGGQLNRGNGLDYGKPPFTPPPGNFAIDYLITYHNGEYWALARFMAGGQYAYPLYKKQRLSLLVRLLGGLQMTRPADYNYYYPNNGGHFSYPYVHLPSTFSYQGDVGLKWQPRGRVALVGYAGYNGAQPSGTFILLEGDRLTGYSYSTVHKKIPTGSLLFRAGIEVGL